MSHIHRHLATYYLPHILAPVSAAYCEILAEHAIAEQFADLHVFMWKMALLEDDYDLFALRRAITRSGYPISFVDLEDIDEAICAYLFDLIEDYGCDLKSEMRTAIAVAGAGLQFSSPHLAAA